MAERTRRFWRVTKPAVQMIKARGFELLDEAGEVRAHLGPVPGTEVGEPGVGLVIFGADRTSQLSMSIDRSGPAIHFTAGGTVLLSIAVLQSDQQIATRTCLLSLRDASGHEVVALSTDRQGGGDPWS